MRTSGCRTHELTRLPTRLDAAPSGVSDRAARSRPRWQVETARAPLTTTMPMAGLHGHTVPGVRNAWTGVAIISQLGRLVLGPAATRQHLSGERISGREALRWLGAPSPGVP
jgi:hypothetical protein